MRGRLAIAALLLGLVGVLTWPWEFLPLRWQYPQAARAVEVIEKFRAKTGRPPSNEEILAVLDPFDLPCGECYWSEGGWYVLIAAASFDWSVAYDSRTGQWSRSP